MVARGAAGERALDRAGERRRRIVLAYALHATGPAESTWLPSGRPSTSCAARDAAEQRLEVDAGLDPHLVEHRDQILGGDVAGRARRHRTAAELAEARLEALDPALERGEHVRQPLAAGVVEVRGQLDPGAEPLGRLLEEPPDRDRVRHPGGVAEADLLGTGPDRATAAISRTRATGTWPS